MLLFMLYFWEASYVWRSLMAQQLNPPVPETQVMQVQSLGQEELLEKEMATHPSILAWKIPWTIEPGGYSLGLTKIQTRLSMRLMYEGQLTVEFMSLKVWEPIRTGDINLGLIKASGELKLTEKRRIFIILWCEKTLNAL